VSDRCLLKESLFSSLEHSFINSMFTTARGQGWVMGSAPITGVILLVFLAFMFICAIQRIRQRPGCYKLFFYSHLLFWPVFVLLVIHSRDFWKWACGPMFLFLCEKLYTLKRYLVQKGRTQLISVKIEDKFTISLTIKRPRRFNFDTGDYVNICFPDIGKIESKHF
jgi:NADPH oxidase 5